MMHVIGQEHWTTKKTVDGDVRLFLWEKYVGAPGGKPAVLFVRSRSGIPVGQGTERAHFLFILLTPAGQPRTHQRLQARIAQLMDSSDYVGERIDVAATPGDLLEAIRTGEMASLG